MLLAPNPECSIQQQSSRTREFKFATMILAQWEAQWEQRGHTLSQRHQTRVELGRVEIREPSATSVTWCNFCSQVLGIKPYTNIALRNNPSNIFLLQQFTKQGKHSLGVLFLVCLLRALGHTMGDILLTFPKVWFLNQLV